MSRRPLFALPLLVLPLVAAIFTGSALAQSCDTSFKLQNSSGATINEFYYNPANNSNWGPDRLGEGVLNAGRSRSWATARGGNYDFRVVWDNGSSAEIRQIDICATSTIIASRGSLTAE